MVNPQKNYTAIANEIMEAFSKIRIPGVERQCLDFILRKTYGYNKKSDIISLSQFEKGTSLKKQYISRALRGLLSKKIIRITNIGNKNGNLFEFNKNYKSWKPLPKKITLPKKIKVVINNDKKSLPLLRNTKVDYTKIDYKKVDYTSQASENNIPLKLSRELFSLILQNDPKAKKPDLRKWAVHMEKLIRIDKRTPEEISQVIRWVQNDDFWAPNILSTRALRKQFSQLWIKFSRQGWCNHAKSSNKSKRFSEKHYEGTPIEQIKWLNEYGEEDAAM